MDEKNGDKGGYSTECGERVQAVRVAIGGALEGSDQVGGANPPNGIGLAARCPVEDAWQSGKLVVPFAFTYLRGRWYCFAYPANKAELPSVVAFREWLLAIGE
ncbi:hypothetical protein [Ralstonia soli]|uniref:LysR substrate-binding domain-containing protein n=1 Tax=Ralstonia soli TaxID=2953896 RepID=A0ABT1ATR0_9RALS|nr:hypothetical protein [Ralstonia soli]MCO5401658.1 hypothetical protein [Ralstonia soli]